MWELSQNEMALVKGAADNPSVCKGVIGSNGKGNSDLNKRYQIFISSTYLDLQEERKSVASAIMKMGHIPAGMEWFTSIDEEQFEFIKRVIDDSDYYVIIIGGRYGNVASDGISYTEKEYDYALSKGIKIIRMVRRSIDEVTLSKTDKNPALSEKLEAFREKVMSGKLADFYDTSADLASNLVISLINTTALFPAVGWVRADRVASEDILKEINDLRKENAALSASASNSVNISRQKNLAGLDEIYNIKLHNVFGEEIYEGGLSWGEIFKIISPEILSNGNEDKIKSVLIGSINRSGSAYINQNIFNQIKVQFILLGFIKIEPSIGGARWALTDEGIVQMSDLLAVKTKLSE
ncbi:DUF4062 domain-containing protein [Asticcacaulis sp.]|uniref:DUF4062 domain-containing protein n=1 Tax=Asticcacaulis sp. TaxID=1872648 RepID=UPI0031CE7885